ncbi:multicopper oxidase family protein [Methylotenera mobilis]|jgi:manganese oxidase|uniref:multicopper oxidase family protein n=1 Tax=Methylotenera mobilis TaxID=359408 RepID=UPI000382ED24|nr:copper oxidase [Methylotenera mobilis]MDP3008178.1 copper oxidase [Methylococcales bacterium]PPC93281.1 MAG: copper oxidase [Methylotenera sp.]
MDFSKFSRRDFFKLAGAGIAASTVSKVAMAALPEIVSTEQANTQAPLHPNTGRPYNPVVTLNGWSLPWRMNKGVKEFHLVAEPVLREMAPGMKAHLWGYNGQSPGPTIEVVEGDKVRIYVTNRLPEITSIHWHGQRLPNGMDGVSGLNQPPIPPGKTFMYEFEAKRAGTFMYHPHADEMLQMAMGMMGSWVTHPKNPKFMPVDRDFVFLLNAYDIDPGSYTPKVNTMLDFNLWTFNSRVFPGIEPIVVKKNDRVRIRVGNLTMTNHPIHLHGHEFQVTGTDGGWVPASARWPEVTTDIAVGQMRAIEFIANEPGDWAFHCHKSHHTMNAMGHDVPTLLGVKQGDLMKKIGNLVPEYMPMGETGMSEMTEMAEMMDMPLPENTLPMMTGKAQFGAVEMGGMFTTVKVREGLARNDYKDPGYFKHPKDTVAGEVANDLPPVERSDMTVPESGVEMKVRKPMGHTGH